MFTAVALQPYAMVAAFSPTSLSRPEFSNMKPSRELHLCMAFYTYGCNSRGGCPLLPRGKPPFYSCNLVWLQEWPQPSVCQQDTGPRWVPSHYPHPEQLGRHVDGEWALQAVSLSLTYHALISPMKYLDTASKTDPSPETLTPRTLWCFLDLQRVVAALHPPPKLPFALRHT